MTTFLCNSDSESSSKGSSPASNVYNITPRDHISVAIVTQFKGVGNKNGINSTVRLLDGGILYQGLNNFDVESLLQVEDSCGLV